MSGYVNISHCKFVRNNYYGGHGTAIHYSSSNFLQVWFTLTNCSFTYNGYAKSLVYTESIMSKPKDSITFKNVNFCHNQGVSIFIKNTARDNGGAILSDQFSEITCRGKSTIMFDGNTADNGGSFYFTNSTLALKDTVTSLLEF